MNQHALAALFVLGVWWLSTGLVLRMVWLRRATFAYSVGAFTGLATAAVLGFYWSSRLESSSAAYLAFVCSIAIWGWHELVFLLGYVTGPRKVACPPDVTGWQRFKLATVVVIHHEVALALTMMGLVWLTWGQPNQIGTWTFSVLWIMRLSAKINVFLGVRNVSEQFVPDHLRYILSYFRRARLNPLMPISIVVGAVVVARLAGTALAPDATSFVLVGRTLVATLLALAVVEHVFLAVPLPDALLWRWAIRSKSLAPASQEAP